MANEFKHKDPGAELTSAEFIAACGDGHIFACQATGDIAYASSATVLSKLAKGSAGTVLSMGCSCIPAWTTNAASATLAATVTVIDSTDTSSFVALFDSATGDLAAKTDAGLAYNSGTGTLTATAFAGPITGNVTGNASGTALTVTQAAQCAITSLGTLTALQVDFINANASIVTITDSSDTGDLASLAVTTHGATTLTTTDDDATAAHFTVDADGNITLDAATGVVTIEDGGTEVLRFTESCSGDVTIKLVTNAKDLIFTDNGDAEGFRILDAAAGVNVAGLLTAGSLDIDNVLINGTTIGHTCDTDLLTIGDAALTIKGTATVGVCGTGHDVKFFGCEAGAYMLYDESEEQLEIRGAAADAATSTGKLLLTTALTNINACDVIGSINFQAPLEAGSCDAILVSAGIRAVAQATFTCAVNATDLIFYTGHSEAAAERFRFTSQNEIGVAGANYGDDGQVLTSGGAGAAVAWECAAGGGGNLILLGSQEISGCSTANITFTNLSATYESYLMVFNAQGTTDGAAWGMRLGCSGGIKTGACDYEWAQAHFLSSTCAYSDGEDPADCEIQIFNASGNCGDEGIAATFWLHTDGDCSAHPVVTGHGVTTYCSGVMASALFGGTLRTSVAVTQWQLRSRSGSLACGSRATLYGLKHT